MARDIFRVPSWSDPTPASTLQVWGSPLSFFVFCTYPIHRVMVNWDPPISQVIHLPGAIQKGNTSIYCIILYVCETLANFTTRTVIQL